MWCTTVAATPTDATFIIHGNPDLVIRVSVSEHRFKDPDHKSVDIEGSTGPIDGRFPESFAEMAAALRDVGIDNLVPITFPRLPGYVYRAISQASAHYEMTLDGVQLGSIPAPLFADHQPLWCVTVPKQDAMSPERDRNSRPTEGEALRKKLHATWMEFQETDIYLDTIAEFFDNTPLGILRRCEAAIAAKDAEISNTHEDIASYRDHIATSEAELIKLATERHELTERLDNHLGTLT